MGRYSPALLVLAFIFLCCTTAYAQDKFRVLNMEVAGTAIINQNDVADAREGAIRNALQKAILETAAAMLSLQGKDKKFLPVKSEISEQPERYINNYKITAEGRQAEVYAVTVNIAIAMADLKNDLVKMGFLQISGRDKSDIIIFLDVKGLKKYSDFSYLKDFLQKRARIVKNIYPRSFEWQQAHLELKISGTAQQLGDELAKTDLYVLGTKEINKNRLELNLLQRGGE